MALAAGKAQIVTFGRKMVTAGLTTGSGGNISVLSEVAGINARKRLRARKCWG